MQSTKATGNVSEAMAIAAFLRAGITVLQPFGDNERYDLVLDHNEGFLRVQCKTAHVERGALVFDACSSYVHRGRKRKDYKGQAELFAVYSPDMDQVYLVPVDAVGVRKGSLRIKPPRNKQVRGIRWADDYKFNGTIPT